MIYTAKFSNLCIVSCKQKFYKFTPNNHNCALLYFSHNARERRYCDSFEYPPSPGQFSLLLERIVLSVMELYDVKDCAPVVCNDLVETSDSPGSPGPARDTQPSEKCPSEVPISNEDTERTFRRRRLISYATLCFCFFFEGWNDASFGPLLPRIQSAYGVSDSSLYVGVAVRLTET